jgi:hypothetical protein
MSAIVRKHKLTIGQVRRQLIKWKDKHCDHGGKEHDFDKEKIKEKIVSRMNDDFNDFVKTLLDGMMPSVRTDDNDMCRPCRQKHCNQHEDGETSLKIVRGDLGFVGFFVKILNDCIDMATEIFPKTTAMAANAQFGFSNTRVERITGEWCVQFLALVQALDPTSPIRLANVNHCRLMLCETEDNLFRSWACQSHTNSLPPIDLLNVESVHKHSRDVVCYTARWMIGKLRAAKIATLENKHLCKQFARWHSLSRADAQSQLLPTSLVDKREVKLLRRPTRQFYNLVCSFEVAHIANVNVDMMQAHSAGDLLGSIHAAIFTDETMLETFRGICMFNEEEQIDEEDILKAFEHILNKFRRMRGKWLARAIHAESAKSNDAVGKMSTRSNVASKFNSAKAAASAARDAIGDMCLRQRTDVETCPEVDLIETDDEEEEEATEEFELEPGPAPVDDDDDDETKQGVQAMQVSM